MLNVKELLALTHSHRSKLFSNAGNVGIAFGKVNEGQDPRGYYRAIPFRALSKGQNKKQKTGEIRIYYPKTRAKVDQYIPPQLRKGKYEGPKEPPKLTADAKVWVFCTCEYFLFHCEVADAERDNSSINYMKRSISTTKNGKAIYITDNNGKAPVITNPSGIAHLCKHLISALRKGALLKK